MERVVTERPERDVWDSRVDKKVLDDRVDVAADFKAVEFKFDVVIVYATLILPVASSMRSRRRLLASVTEVILTLLEVTPWLLSMVATEVLKPERKVDFVDW